MRRDAAEKVTGRLRYTGEDAVDGALHAALVTSTAAGGRVRLDLSAAAASHGVAGIMTHENAPRLQPGDGAWLLQDAAIRHAGQPVALVLAETSAQARRAAARVRVHVDLDPLRPVPTDFDAALATAFSRDDVYGQPPDSVRGDPDAALTRADLLRVDATYTTPTHVHSPLEPHAVLARWHADRVLVRTSTSGIFRARAVIARAFGLPLEDVRVLCPYQGGGFGSKGSAWWPSMLLAVSAAKLYRRPVLLRLAREQMFAMVGNRQRTRQEIAVAADRAGRLVAIRHEAVSETGMARDDSEATCVPTRTLYVCPNVAVRHRLVRTHTPPPSAMRGTGEACGTFALESALDELAVRLDLDPVELRLRNVSAWDPHAERPWSSNSLRECLRSGAEAFGWSRRGPARSMHSGGLRIGWGVASSYYPGLRAPAAARIRLHPGGRIQLEVGTQEIGTGICTIMAEAAARALGAPVDAISVRLGDTFLPESPMAAGAMVTASVIPAVEAAARALRERVVDMAVSAERSSLRGLPPVEVAWASPTLLRAESGVEQDIAALLESAGLPFAEAEARTQAPDLPCSVATFGACFAEVGVAPDLGDVRVTRLTAAYAAGRILNRKLAENQLIGGIVFGIGMALHEKVDLDPRTGRVTNASLMDYLVPVHADIPDIQILFVDEEDPHVPSGVKGLGMSGTVGIAAAIASAVYHATGIRIRDLPIRPESLLTQAAADR